MAGGILQQASLRQILIGDSTVLVGRMPTLDRLQEGRGASCAIGGERIRIRRWQISSAIRTQAEHEFDCAFSCRALAPFIRVFRDARDAA